MDFGKLKNIQGIDLSLPPDDRANARVLAKPVLSKPDKGLPAIEKGLPATEPFHFRAYVGLPVWQDDALAARLCTPGTPKAKRLACYARQFHDLELNSTGYGLDPAHARHWAGEVTPGFKFCPKVPRDVSHESDLDYVWDRYATHCESAFGLGSHLGPFLLQFPDTFGPSRFPELERFLAAQAARLPIALEVRQASWFRDQGAKAALLDMLEAYGVTSVLTDTPGRRDVLHQRLTTRTAYIRFNGVTPEAGDPERLERWAERIRAWRAGGLQTLYFFVHLERQDLAVELAARFIAMLNRVVGTSMPEPRLQIEVENMSLFP